MRSVIENAPYEHLIESAAKLQWRVGSEKEQFVVDQNVWSASAESLDPWSPESDALVVEVEAYDGVRDRLLSLSRKLGGSPVLCVTWSCVDAGIRGVGLPAAVRPREAARASLRLPPGLLRGSVRLCVECFLSGGKVSPHGASTGARIACLGPRQEVLIDGSGGSLPIEIFEDSACALWGIEFPSLEPTSALGADGCLLRLNRKHRDYPALRDLSGKPTALMHEIVSTWLTLLVLEYATENAAQQHSDAIFVFHSTGEGNLAAFVGRAAEGAGLELWGGGSLAPAMVQQRISDWVNSSRVGRLAK
jgi:hypothetical protein